MKLVEPTWYLIARPWLTGGMQQFLDDNEIKWKIPTGVSDYEVIAEFAGRLCYESWPESDNLNISKIREGNKEYLSNVIKQRHGSIFEHGNLVFLFSNVSRIFTHELVRHRAGSAFSQTSGRYVRLRDIKFWIPDCIWDNLDARSVFLRAVQQDEENQEELENIFAVDLAGSFDKKKELTSAFRRIHPAGAANNILWSTNMRALRHIIQLRCSEHAEVEIRIMFRQIADFMKINFPSIFDDMTDNYTFESEHI